MFERNMAHHSAVYDDEQGGTGQRRLSEDWIIDESWWGDEKVLPVDFGIAAQPHNNSSDADNFAPISAVVNIAHGDVHSSRDDSLHRELRVYICSSSYLLVPVEHRASGESPAVTGSSTGASELIDEALVVPRNPPHKILKASHERVQFLKAHSHDVIIAQAFLGIAQLEFDAFLVLLTASQAVTTLPQGVLRRVTDAKILPIGIDSAGVHWYTGTVLSPTQSMLPSGSTSGDWASSLAKRSFMLRSFKDMLKSGWLLFSWDFDCSRNQQAIASLAEKKTSAHCTHAGAIPEPVFGGLQDPGGGLEAGARCEARVGSGAASGRAAAGARAAANAQAAGITTQSGALGWPSAGDVDGHRPASAREQGRAGKERVKEWCEEQGRERGWDMRFVWNATWLEPVLRCAQEDHAAASRWLVPLVYGFAESVCLEIDKLQAEMVLIARRSRKRAGVRFCRRGIDAEGNVANFVETEQIVQVGNLVSSFVCIRGSIPLFWKQDTSDWTHIKPKLILQQCKPLNIFPEAMHALHDDVHGHRIPQPCSDVIRREGIVAKGAAEVQSKQGHVAAPASADRLCAPGAGDVAPGAGDVHGAGVGGADGCRWPAASESGSATRHAVKDGAREREGGKLRLNGHDVGLARHFDQLRAVYGNVLVLSLVEHHGSEAPLGSLFKKTLLRYMRSLPGDACAAGDRGSSDMPQRDRDMSFCNVPSPRELAAVEACCARQEMARGRDAGASTSCMPDDASHGASLDAARDARQQHADADRDRDRDSDCGHDQDLPGNREQNEVSVSGAEEHKEGENRETSLPHREAPRTKYMEFSLHSAVKGSLSASAGGMMGGAQLHLEHMFGADLPEVEACGMFVCGVKGCNVSRGGVLDGKSMKAKEGDDGRDNASWLGDVMMKQSGVLRINCIDCLDRTNVAMSLVARSTLARQLECMGVLREDEAAAMSSGDESCFPHAQEAVKGVWATHGDALSLQYAGSQALQSDVTRTGRRTLQGLLSDSVSSVQRYVQRSLYDTSAQEMLDCLLGEREPFSSERDDAPPTRSCSASFSKHGAPVRSPDIQDSSKDMLDSSKYPLAAAADDDALPRGHAVAPHVQEAAQDAKQLGRCEATGPGKGDAHAHTPSAAHGCTHMQAALEMQEMQEQDAGMSRRAKASVDRGALAGTTSVAVRKSETATKLEGNDGREAGTVMSEQGRRDTEMLADRNTSQRQGQEAVGKGARGMLDLLGVGTEGGRRQVQARPWLGIAGGGIAGAFTGGGIAGAWRREPRASEQAVNTGVRTCDVMVAQEAGDRLEAQEIAEEGVQELGDEWQLISNV